ncbi:MAG TPA: hypothetical protein DCY93_01885 [Firmicutes bacterium]|nr:hypothetical protein [Bacillota bacterium]
MTNLIIVYVLVVALIVAFILTTYLVSHNHIMKYTDNWVKRFFAHPMLMYSIRRILSAFISLLLTIIVTFFLLRIDDPRTVYCAGKWIKFSPQQQEFLCSLKLHRLGLDQNLFVQLIRYIYDILPFPKSICVNEVTNSSGSAFICLTEKVTLINFGTSTSISPGKQVVDFFTETMPWSLYIGLGGLVIEIFIGYPMGVMMAKYKNRWFDKLGNAYIILVGSIPGLVYYYILQALFTEVFGLPIIWDRGNVISWIPQMLTLGLGGVAGIALWVRRYMVDEFGADYVKFARSKGVPENTILFKHVLRNAAVPLVRSIPAGVIYCLLGSYFVESIYNVEGFGDLLITSINRNDYPLTQAIVVVSAIISIIASLVGDITTAIADPRVSLTSKN